MAGIASGSSSRGSSAFAAWTSAGSSTLTGPRGGVSAIRAADRRTEAHSPGVRTWNAAFEIAASISGCAFASWMNP